MDAEQSLVAQTVLKNLDATKDNAVELGKHEGKIEGIIEELSTLRDLVKELQENKADKSRIHAFIRAHGLKGIGLVISASVVYYAEKFFSLFQG